ncbi:hypothetical protein LKO27_06980 [Tessaracoccus sp. OS52]|uniref:NfeD family protein n=1 Tax=Tessaracoccus sp. OS52 TaxID=2886691 RepID=UPI001D11C8BF|nr:hypothetical protein [Tessaracoccus sp. OS52]
MAVFLTIGVIGIVVVLAALLLGDAIESVIDVDALGGDLFSLASIAAFIGAFGFGGYISLALADITWLAVVVGVVSGTLAGWGAASLTRWLKRSESAATFRSDRLIGSPGKVITDIPEGGYGEVRIFGQGASRKRAARSEVAIPAGTEVWVSAILSPTAVEVTASHQLPAPPE